MTLLHRLWPSSNSAWPFKSTVMLHLTIIAWFTWWNMHSSQRIKCSQHFLKHHPLYPILQLKEISLSIICLVVEVDKYTTSILETAKVLCLKLSKMKITNLNLRIWTNSLPAVNSIFHHDNTSSCLSWQEFNDVLSPAK